MSHVPIRAFTRWLLLTAFALSAGFCSQVARGASADTRIPIKDPAKIAHVGDLRVSVASTFAVKDDLDGSPAVEYRADLRGPGARWGGCSLPVAKGSVPAGADIVEFDARMAENSRSMLVVLRQADGSLWTAGVQSSDSWRHYAVPAYRFDPDRVNKDQTATRPDFTALSAIEFRVKNTIDGVNGFAVGSVKLSDAVPTVILRCVSNTTVSLQKPALLAIEAAETTGARPASFNGELWVSVPDRVVTKVPERVAMHEGRAEIPVFPRSPGATELTLYEPYHGYELRVPLNVVQDGLRVDLSFGPEYEQQRIVNANQELKAKLLLSGSATMPRSMNLRLRDHVGREIFAHTVALGDVYGGKARFAAPSAGLLSADVRLLKEPISELPHALIPWNEAKHTTATQVLPAGVTAMEVIGTTVTLEEVPSTATVLCEDHFDVWSVTPTPSENLLYKCPFGLCGAPLFDMPAGTIQRTAEEFGPWHRRADSYIARSEFPWKETEPTSGTFEWEKADAIIKEYRDLHQKVAAVLCCPPSWTGNAAPSDQAGRDTWAAWIDEIFKRFPAKIMGYATWNEPNGPSWPPAPDPDAYGELVKVTYQHLRKITPNPRTIAGETDGFDPGFLGKLLEDGYAPFFDVLSFHWFPEQLSESPEQNGFPDICDAAHELLRHGKAGAKEIWFSELGWPTCLSGVGEKEQANYVTRTYTLALAHHINKVYWYSLFDVSPVPWKGGARAHMGLIDTRFRPKPAVVAFNLVQFMLPQLTFRDETHQGKASIYTFDIMMQSYKWKGVMHVAWTPLPGDEQDIELPIGAGGPLYVMDYLGAEREAKLIREERAENANLQIGDESTTQAKPGSGSPTVTAATAQSSPTLAADDQPTTRTYRFRINHEPLYIWDAGAAPKRHGPPHKD